MARQGGPAAAGQQVEAVVQPRRDLRPASAPSPARRPAPAPAGCRPAAGRSAPRPAPPPGRAAESRAAPPPPAPQRAGPPGTGSTCATAPGRVRRELLRVRGGQRGHPPGDLAGEPQPLAAGRQEAQLRTGLQQASGPAPPPPRSGARSCPAPAASVARDSQPMSACMQRSGRRCLASSCSPSAAATKAGSRAGSASGASSTNSTRSGNCGSSPAATCSASRVLPTPPPPTSVTSREEVTSR